MSMDNKIKSCGLFMKLNLFQTLYILLIFDIKIVINNSDIQMNEINFRKILKFLLFSHLLIYCKQSNVLVNMFVISDC